jgi:hypothetical protein
MLFSCTQAPTIDGLQRIYAETPSSTIEECRYRRKKFLSRQAPSADVLKDVNAKLRLYWFHRYHALQLRHNLEYLRVQGPVVQVGYGTFE